MHRVTVNAPTLQGLQVLPIFLIIIRSLITTLYMTLYVQQWIMYALEYDGCIIVVGLLLLYSVWLSWNLYENSLIQFYILSLL